MLPCHIFVIISDFVLEFNARKSLVVTRQCGPNLGYPEIPASYFDTLTSKIINTDGKEYQMCHILP